MTDILKIKSPFEMQIRQIEIAAVCSFCSLTKSELAGSYGVDDETIKRDLSILRKEGIQAHSKKNSGIIIELSDCINIHDKIYQYLILRNSNYIDHTAIDSLISIFGKKALFYLVIFYKFIEAERKLGINYNGNSLLKGIQPLSLWLANGEYRILCKSEGVIKQYIKSKISSMDISDRIERAIRNSDWANYFKIKEISENEEVNNILKYSWNGWISADSFEIKLALRDYFKDKIIIPDQISIESNENENVMTGKVSSIEEFAKYVVASSGRIKALEPRELIDETLSIAKAATKAHIY